MHVRYDGEVREKQPVDWKEKLVIIQFKTTFGNPILPITGIYSVQPHHTDTSILPQQTS